MGELMTANVRHFCNIGDIVTSLIGLKKYYELTGKKLIFMQQLNVRGRYYEGAKHPVVHNGEQVMTNQAIWDLIVPLLKSQDYIEDAVVYNGQKVDIDFTVIRQHIFVNMPNQAIQQWLFIAFPDIAADISKPWMTIPEVDISNCKLQEGDLILPVPELKDKVIVNFTERYRNENMDYFFLKNYKEQLIFSGTLKEYELFTQRWELDIPLLIVDNFLQLAYILKQSKFLLSNQSFQWNVCEAAKIPRLLELCAGAPNCQSFIGEDSYGYLNQIGLVYYFETLMSKK